LAQSIEVIQIGLRGANGRGIAAWQCLTALALLTVVDIVGRCILVLHGLSPSRSAELLCGFEFRLILAWWVAIDRRVRGFRAPFEFDAFVFFAWPILVPYYLYRTRGGRSLFVATVIYALAVISNVAVAIVRMALDG
jgi:hypothetical protein